MHFLDRAAAWLGGILGVAHLAVGHAAFLAPTERRIWFASAGFLLIVTCLANLAARGAETRLQVLPAIAGNISILIIGGLLAAADPRLLGQPQTLVLLAIGLLLTSCRFRDFKGLGADRH